MTARTQIAAIVRSLRSDGVSDDVIRRALETAQFDERELPPATSRASGTRLPEDWEPSSDDIAYAAGRGMARDRVQLESEKFRNYWIAKSGRDAAKRDWNATWRNWVIRALEVRHGEPGNRPLGTNRNARSLSTGADAILAGMGKLAHRCVQRRSAERSNNGPVSRDPDVALELPFEPG